MSWEWKPPCDQRKAQVRALTRKGWTTSASIIHVHIARGGYNDDVTDWIIALCGRKLTLSEHMGAWEHADDNVSCSRCLAIYDENQARGPR
jgi:hypothetical protein